MAIKGLKASPPETDCDQTAMSLPFVTSAVILEKRGRLGAISEMPLLPLRG
jgi:hypothetical protein